MASSPRVAAVSSRVESSTPYPTGMLSDSISSRRAAHSPASGWTTPDSSGHHRLSRGRATSSVTRPPSVEVEPSVPIAILA